MKLWRAAGLIFILVLLQKCHAKRSTIRERGVKYLYS